MFFAFSSYSWVTGLLLKATTGKLWGHYRANSSTEAFLVALSADIGIPISELAQSFKGGDPKFQGTWVHPQVAIHLAQWLSPKFAVKVSQWVYEWMSKAGKPSGSDVPYHLRRYVANQGNLPVRHFSVLTEMTQALIAPMEI